MDIPHIVSASLDGWHRRRMETEAKAKVVASVWGAKFVQFLAALAVLSRLIWNETVECILFFQMDHGKKASAARNWTNFASQTDATIFVFASVSILLLLKLGGGGDEPATYHGFWLVSLSELSSQKLSLAFISLGVALSLHPMQPSGRAEKVYNKCSWGA